MVRNVHVYTHTLYLIANMGGSEKPGMMNVQLGANNVYTILSF